jgi:hypothetical protein
MIVSPYYSFHNHGLDARIRTAINDFGDRCVALTLHRDFTQIEEYSVAVFVTLVTTKTSKSILLFGRGCKNRTYDLGIKIQCDTISPIPN